MDIPGWQLTLFAISFAVYLLFSVLRIAFRALTPIDIKNILDSRISEGHEFVRKSLLRPTPLWFSLLIGSKITLVVMSVLLFHLLTNSGLFLERSWRHAGLLITAILSVALLIIVAELALSKIVQEARAERVMVKFFGVFKVIHFVFYPVSSLIWRFSFQEDASGAEEVKREEEMEEIEEAFIDAGEREGILEEDESQMLRSIFDFGDTVVREILKPRTEIVAVEKRASLADLRKLVVEEKHSRIPVYEEDIDHIVGVANIRDLLEKLDGDNELTPVGSIMREAYFVPETKKVADLLKEFQENRIQIAIVINEYGGTSGMVTMEDLLEEIVGEIEDEYGELSPDITLEKDGSFLVDASAPIDDVNEFFNLHLHESTVETFGGWVSAKLGRIPERGEVIEHESYQLKIADADEKKIEKIRVFKK